MRIIKIFFVDCIIKIFNYLISIIKFFLWFKKPKKIKKIIVYKIGNIGDIITIYPSVSYIRKLYPDAKIDFLTSPGNIKIKSAAQLLKNQKVVDNIIMYYDDDIKKNNIIKLIKRLRSSSYELGYIFNDDKTPFLKHIRNLFFFRLLKIKYVYSTNLNRIELFKRTYSSKKPYPYINEVQRNLDLFKTNFSSNDIKELFFYKKNEPEKLVELKNSISIAIGAKFSYKKWSLSNFFEVSKLFLVKMENPMIFYIGDKFDEVQVNKIIKLLEKDKDILNLNININDALKNLCNKTSMNESINIIQNSKILLCNDSGPGHLSSFTDTKTISIQSPSDFRLKWDPYFSKDLVLRPFDEICSCTLNDCNCIDLITYDKVWDLTKGII